MRYVGAVIGLLFGISFGYLYMTPNKEAYVLDRIEYLYISTDTGYERTRQRLYDECTFPLVYLNSSDKIDNHTMFETWVWCSKDVDRTMDYLTGKRSY